MPLLLFFTFFIGKSNHHVAFPVHDSSALKYLDTATAPEGSRPKALCKYATPLFRIFDIVIPLFYWPAAVGVDCLVNLFHQPVIKLK